MITGAKKKAGKQHRPHIAKDSAASTNYFHGLYGLSEGEISGLVDGGKSIELDGTPLVNDNGQPNFPNIQWDFRAGTTHQEHIAGFGSINNERGLNVEIRHNKAFTQYITDTKIDAVVIRLSWNALRETKDNGDVVGYRIDYAIDVQTDGGVWREVQTYTINDKTSNNYQRSHRIDLPKAKHGWTVRVRRITPNRDSDLIGDKMHVVAITEVIDAKLRYPCTALLSLKYDAETFSNIAKVSVYAKGKLIQVPSNYNPDTRTYTGLWDGTFYLAYSNNPAWVYYDLCTHKRYGLGNRLADKVDKWALYQLAQYCDEMVDDGKGGQEPRFTCNVYLQKADDAYQVLQNIASVFRGMSYWNGIQVIVDADIPKDAVYTFSTSNVVNGEFVYTGTRARDKHTIAKVAYDDPDNDFKTDYVMVRDDYAIAKYGISMVEMSAFGCTSRGQAERAGVWALNSEQLETQMVSFKTGLQGFIPQVGQVINIADNVRAGRAITGKIQGVNKRQITLDRQAGKVGDTFTDENGNTATITQINGNIITLDKTPTANVGEIWAIKADDLHLAQFRIMSISHNDDDTFSITALQYEPSKYRLTDTGARFTPKPVSVIKPTVLSAPQTVSINANSRAVQGVSVTTMTINWSQVVGAVAYIVKWRKDDGNWQTHKVTGQSLDIDGVYAGNYTAQVQAIDAFDNESLATSSTLTQIQGKIGRPPRLARLTVQGKLFGMDLAWTFNKGSDDTNYTEIQVSPDGRSNITTLGTFAYPTNKHEITGLQGNLTQYYRARIVDKLGNTSDWTAWVSGTTSAQADKVLDLIQGQISQSHLDQSLRAPIGKIGTIENGLNGVKGQIPTLQSAISAINGQLPTLNQSLATAQRELSTTKQQLTTAQNTLNTAVANITTERNRITSAIRDITALQSANNAKTQEIANLVQTVNGHTSSIRELGVTTGDLAQKYNQVKTQSDKATSDITQIKQTQSGQATSIDRLGARFDNLAVGGRNYLLGSNVSRNSHGSTYLQISPSLDVSKLRHFVLSCDVSYTNARRATAAGSKWFRIGLELSCTYTDGSRKWFGVWKHSINNGDSFDGRISALCAVPQDKTLARIDSAIIQIWDIVADTMLVKNPKLELGTVATDYTEAPEDIQADIDQAKTQAEANINTMHETLTNANTALGRRIDDVSAEFKQADNTIKASIQSETQARTNADAAIAQTVNALQSDHNNNKSSVASQIKTLTDAKNSQATQISQITANVTTAQNTANTANSKADDGIRRASNAQSKADTADVKATQAKADIIAEQQARVDGYGSLARQMSALDSKFTNADNAIKASVAQAQKTATNTQQALATAQSQMSAKIDGLSVGGRNLVRNSDNIGWNNAAYTLRLPLTEAPNVGDDVIVTLWGEISELRTGVGFYNTQGYGEIGKLVKIAEGVYQGRGKWKLPMNGDTPRTPNNTHLNIYFYPNDITKGTNIVNRVKLEKGTIATDYTPAPEDVQSQLDSKASTASLDEYKQAQATKEQATAQRINTLDTAYKLADTTLTARIAREETARASANAALTQILDSLRNEFNGNKSSIDTQLRTLSDKNNTQAQKLSQIESSLGQKANVAALNQTDTKVGQIEGRITAEANKYNTLQTTVGQHTASIQVMMQSVNGLKSQYTLKVESGGIVAGIGLASENGKSRFAVRADVIDIVAPDGTKRPMFSVLTTPQTINGVSVPKGVYLDSAYIARGSINMLHIADSIQSDNYVAGRSGWRLFKNGTLEINSTFNDGTRIQLNSRGLVGFYANGRKAFELGYFT